MVLNIKATNLKLTPELKEYVEKKVGMLEKYHADIIKTQAEVELTTNHHLKGEIYRAELNVTVPGKLLRVEKTAKDINKALDKAKDHMAEELCRFKGKKMEKIRRAKVR